MREWIQDFKAGALGLVNRRDPSFGSGLLRPVSTFRDAYKSSRIQALDLNTRLDISNDSKPAHDGLLHRQKFI